LTTRENEKTPNHPAAGRFGVLVVFGWDAAYRRFRHHPLKVTLTMTRSPSA